MPYRRLPNTDSARKRALHAAAVKGEQLTPQELAFSQSLLLKIRSFLPEFEQTIKHYKEQQNKHAARNQQYQEVAKKARLYLSHFIQVLNMSITRGEHKPDIREHYNIARDDKRVPSLATDNDLIRWGYNIISGEEKRLATGASPITNPTIAIVKVHFQDFEKAFQNQQQLQQIIAKSHKRVVEVRQKADDYILQLWNEVERHFDSLNPVDMRNQATKYGIKYVYRKNERLGPFLNVNYGSVS